jgi:hypothetical protein
LSNLAIIETGTLRNERPDHRLGDGWSTIYFRTLIDRVGGTLHSVDIDPQHIDVSTRVIEREFGDLDNTFHCCEDSVAFLRRFDKSIDILYLDSLDYSGDDSAARHQLAEIEAAFEKLSNNGIVVVDDILESIDQGKAALSIPFLKSRGWSNIELFPVRERKQQKWFQAIIRAKGQ